MQPATRNYVLLFCGAFLFHVAGTWLLPLVDRDEPRFAEASREMIERSDYVVPYFNNRYRFDKPPLTYWAQVASYRIFGENPFAARLPTAIAAALVAVVIFAWGRRVNLERAGWWAAIFFTLCLQSFMHGKAAVADMWLVLFVSLAHWAGYEMVRDRYGGTWRSAVLRSHDIRGWWWVFYLALALGFLAKGPIAWVPLGTVVLYRAVRPVPHFARRFLFVRGILLVLLLIGLWGVPALIRTHGEFFAIGIGRHVVERSFGDLQGHGSKSLLFALGSLPFFFVTVFLSFAPWSVKLPWLVRRLWQKRDAFDLYLILGTALVFGIFSLVRTKLPHYTLPAFPLLALLLARQWLAAGVTTQHLRCWTIATAAVWLAVALIAFPLIAPYSLAAALFKKSEAYLQPEMNFGSYDFQEPSITWVFRSKVRGWSFRNQRNGHETGTLQPYQVHDFLASKGPHFVILPSKVADRLYPTLPSGYRKFTIHGFDFAAGQWIDLTLILKNT